MATSWKLLKGNGLEGLLQKEVVDRIVEEVLYRLNEMKPKDTSPEGTVVLVTSFVPSFTKASELIRSRYGEDVTYINFSGVAFPSKLERIVSAEEIGTDAVLALVNGSDHVVLLTPRLKLIGHIAEGSDEDFVEFLIIRSLLWGRHVSVVLDFKEPSFKRNTFFEKIVSIVDVLEDIGIDVVSYDCSYERSSERTLITEADVLDEWKKGHKKILSAAGGIITPSAKDKAMELGMRIN
jgi:hypothetical protein